MVYKYAALPKFNSLNRRTARTNFGHLRGLIWSSRLNGCERRGVLLRGISRAPVIYLHLRLYRV